MTYLFENRYRCEHIFPRGRSGEVIQAFDIQEDERPVIIKRPVPRDAPPIRARQEANLILERRALQLLAGHPAINVLLRSDYFSINGARHLYLVLEHAEGFPLSETVRQQSSSGQAQGLLELLRIAEQLIDLLMFAHEKGIVYNDVAARHLYWQRATHRLTVIDWGNAVFIREKPVNQHHIGVQDDVKQVGEWLYYMLTRGRVPAIPREAGAEFSLDFGVESTDLDESLIAILTKACHPNRKLQYASMKELAKGLHRYRQPKVQEFQIQINELSQKSPSSMAGPQLAEFREKWKPLWRMDPSDHRAHEIKKQIEAREAELNFDQTLQEISAAISEMDWKKAEQLLASIQGNEDEGKRSIVSGLLECVLFLKQQILMLPPLPAPIMIACEAIQAGEPANAIETLIASDEHSDLGLICWLLAEHLQTNAPGFEIYLRPPLFRLRRELTGDSLIQLGKLIIELENTLSEPRPTLEMLATAYETMADAMKNLSDSPDYDGTLQPVLDQANRAASSLTNLLREMASTASISPSAALNLLERCRRIDHQAKAWVLVETQLMAFQQYQEHVSQYAPKEAGLELDIWLKNQAENFASLYILDHDPRLDAMQAAFKQAEDLWLEITGALVRGNRRNINERLPQIRTGIRAYVPQLARWFETWQELLQGEPYLQRHAMNEAWGSAMADGWLAYDRGNLKEAAIQAEAAHELAGNEEEMATTERLSELLSIVHELQTDAVRKEFTHAYQILKRINAQFLPEEKELLDEFEDQIPQLSTYLRAMTVGIVEPLKDLSPAASRLLHLRCLLLGILAIQQNDAKEADEWRMAANQCGLPVNHPINECLIELQMTRETLWEAATRINQLNGVHGIEQLGSCHDYLVAHPEAERLSNAAVSLDAVRKALESWGRADYVAATDTLMRADEAAESTEQSCHVQLSPYRTWLHSLLRASRALNNLMGKIRGKSRQAETTHELIYEGTGQLRDRSQRLVGETYSHTVSAWHESSEAFAEAISSNGRRSLILARLEELFRRPHIAQHPALPLFQRWFERIDRAPEFPDSEEALELVEEMDIDQEETANSDPDASLRYAFSQPPRAQDEEAIEEEEPDEIAASIEEFKPARPARQLHWLYIVFIGAILATLLTIIMATSIRTRESDQIEESFLAGGTASTASNSELVSIEMDVFSWLQNREPDILANLSPLEDGGGWEITAIDSETISEFSLTNDDLLAISENGFRVVAAEFLYETEKAAAGFGLQLRQEDQSDPVFSLLAQPASGGTLKLTLHENGQFLLREIHTLTVPIARISLRLDPVSGELRALINETPIGESLILSGDLLPTLFVNANASVRVLRWTITPA